METIKITLLSDYACPFCYVGKEIIKKASKEYPIELLWLPFELNQDAPAAGIKKENTPEMEQMLAGLNRDSEGLGIKFNPFDKMPNTRLALQASEFARDHGKLNEFQELLYKALFTENKDIGQLDLILSYAQEVGLNLDELRKALEEEIYMPRLQEGRELGEKLKIELIPTFIVNDKELIVGSHSYKSFVVALENALKGVSAPIEPLAEKGIKACGPEGCKLY